MKLKRLAYWVSVVILSLVIALCVTLIARKLITDYQDKLEYNKLIAMMEAAKEETTAPTQPPAKPEGDSTEPSTEPTEPTQPQIFAEYKPLYELNQDMVGWIEIEGTNINYPVVQSLHQANYYLDRNFNGEKASCGAIYARELCDINKPSDNIVLYGHNMANGTMFGQIHDFKKKDFFDSHRYIRFDTLYERHTYEIFALFLISAGESEPFRYHVFSDADTAEEFDSFVQNCISRSYYDTGIVPEYGDKLITLSTCDRSITDGRLVLVARRID